MTWRVELAPVHEDVRTQRGHGLGRGPHVGERVPLPRPVPATIRPATPQVHNGLATRRDRDACANLTATGEVFGERLAHRLKASRAGAVNLDLHSPPRPFPHTAPA